MRLLAQSRTGNKRTTYLKSHELAKKKTEKKKTSEKGVHDGEEDKNSRQMDAQGFVGTDCQVVLQYLGHDVMVFRPSGLIDNGQVHHRPGRRRLLSQVPVFEQHLRKQGNEGGMSSSLTQETKGCEREEQVPAHVLFRHLGVMR